MTQSSLIDSDFSYLEENYRRITSEIAEAAIASGRAPSDVRLMAVTKTVAPDIINRMLSLGVGLMGENKVQELLSKLEFLNTENTEIHIIGHLQSNKVRKIINIADMIQSVDSISLAEEISRQAVKNEKTMDILIEINIGDEEAKTGLPKEELSDTVHQITAMDGINVRGLMCVPPICDDEKTVRKYFAETKRLFEDTKGLLGNKADFDVLSMGMSGDFVPAIKEGATLVRVGSALFGKRRY